MPNASQSQLEKNQLFAMYLAAAAAGVTESQKIPPAAATLTFAVRNPIWE